MDRTIRVPVAVECVIDERPGEGYRPALVVVAPVAPLPVWTGSSFLPTYEEAREDAIKAYADLLAAAARNI